MALRILQNELFSHHPGVLQRLLSTERILSSAANPAVVVDTINPTGNEKPKERKAHAKIAPHFRTTETNPVNHNDSHSARFYTVPEPLLNTVFQYGGVPTLYKNLCHVFTETCVMVRRPFLEIASYAKSVDYTKPAVRIVLYGQPGLGKSMTLTHVLHYGHNAGYMLVNVPWVNSFMRRCKSVAPSESKPGMMDTPINASAWLVHFKSQNQQMLQKLNLKLSKTYQYGLHDTFEKGEPLEKIIEFGVSRAKYATDIIEDLLREIKAFSNSGLFKTMVVIDGFNALFAPFIKTERRKIIEARCTLALPFLEITQFDWCNGIVILSVDRHAHVEPFNAESDLPLYLLGKEGWEHLDPFIPIKVDKYDTAEINSALDYFIDRRWIQHPSGKSEQGRAELRTLSAGSGMELMKLCGSM